VVQLLSASNETFESLGGRATSSVMDRTDYLVVGENPGNRLDEARQREVATNNEKRFIVMMHENQRFLSIKIKNYEIRA
jgi:DNA ligase (NAD+)